MRHRPLFHWILPATLVAASMTALFGSAASPTFSHRISAAPPARAELAQAYGKLPLSFEVNRGQADPGVTFLARGQGYTVSLTRTGAAVALRRPAQTGAPGSSLAGRSRMRTDPSHAVMRLELLGANPNPATAGLDELPGTANYFIGSDPSKWHTGIPTYARVKLHGVYPGIDLTYYGSERNLEYDFSVAPWADPKVIAMGFPGADQLQVGPEGNLMVRIAGARVLQLRPVAYQPEGASRRPIGARYVLGPDGAVSVRLAAYDHGRPLVIDPTLAYSTYLGGSGTEEATGIAVDASGSAYVTGFTASQNFPTASPFQAGLDGTNDVFVTKLNPAGSALVYSTYLGGSGSEEGLGIAVDASGNAYVTGDTTSNDFPPADPFQAMNPGGGAFVTKLNPAGSALVYSTYLGGGRNDGGTGIAVDRSGSAYVTGFTFSPEDFPTADPIQEMNAGASDAFVTKFNPAGSGLVYSTYLGGRDNDGRDTAIAVDGSGRAYLSGETLSMNFPTANPFQPAHDPVSGYDIFVTKLNAAGSAFVYSTYLGGEGNDGGAGGHGIAADASGNAYVTGFTSSGDFPRMNPFQEKYGGAGDAFVTKLNAAGSALVYSTFLGDGNLDEGRAIAVDGAGNAYVTGRTASPLFPTASPIQDELGDAAGGDGFVTKLNPAGSALVYSTFLGGRARDDGRGIAVDASGNNAYVTGDTSSIDFPRANPIQVMNGGGTEDAFVAKISTAPSCTIHGTNQDDLLVGSSAADTICGRGGDDTIDGRAGDDDLRGGAGDDTIVGRAGADVIRGGAGNDDINGRDGVAGNDTVYGDTGHDVCVIDGGDTTFGCETVTFLAGPQQAK